MQFTIVHKDLIKYLSAKMFPDNSDKLLKLVYICQS